MPIIGAVFGGLDFSNYFLGLSSSRDGDATSPPEGARGGLCLWQFHHRAHQFPDRSLDLFMLVKAANKIRRDRAGAAARAVDDG